MPTLLLDGLGISAALDRMAADIMRREPIQELAVVGIVARGDVLAQRLINRLRQQDIGPVDHGSLDITLYRDDIRQPSGQGAVVRPTRIPFSLDGRHVLLVDDVIHTGRTIRAALDAVHALGRPRVLRLAVLVDRGGRQLPVQPDFVGVSIDAPHHRVQLTLVDQPPEGESVMLL